MLQFKRFFIIIYMHLTLSVFFLFLGTFLVVKFDFLTLSWQQAFFGLLWTIMIFAFIGIIWGLVAIEEKKLVLPLGFYMLMLIGLFGFGFTSEQNWVYFLYGNLPYGYFIRNVTTRDIFVLFAYASSCVLPSLCLLTTFKLSYKIVHHKA